MNKEKIDGKGIFALFLTSLISIIFMLFFVIKKTIQEKSILTDNESFSMLVSKNNFDFPNFIMKNITPDNYFNYYIPLIVFLMLAIIIIFTFITYFILKKNIKKIDNTILFSILILFFSPIFLYKFVNISPELFGLLMTLIIINICLFGKGKIKYTSYLFSILISTLSFKYAFLSSFLILLFAVYYKKKILYLNYFITLAFIIIKLIFIGSINLEQSVNVSNILLNLIRETSNFYGLSIFFIITAIAGVIFILKKRFTFGILSLIISYLFLIQKSTLLFSFILIYFTTVFLKDIFSKKWELETLRIIAGTIFISFMMFNSIQASFDYISADPSKEDIKFYSMINEKLESNILLVPPDKNNEIQFFTDFKVFPKSRKEELEVKQIYYSNVLERTLELMHKNRIKYIYVDEKMKQEIWNYEIKGLLNHLNNKKHFKKVLSYENYEIYEFQRENLNP